MNIKIACPFELPDKGGPLRACEPLGPNLSGPDWAAKNHKLLSFTGSNLGTPLANSAQTTCLSHTPKVDTEPGFSYIKICSSGMQLSWSRQQSFLHEIDYETQKNEQ